MQCRRSQFDSWVGKESRKKGWRKKGCLHQYSWASLVTQMVKNRPAMQETWVGSPGQEDPLEEGMATHSSILAWRIPMDRGDWWLQSMGSQRAGHDWVTEHIINFITIIIIATKPQRGISKLTKEMTDSQLIQWETGKEKRRTKNRRNRLQISRP